MAMNLDGKLINSLMQFNLVQIVLLQACNYYVTIEVLEVLQVYEM